jgi:hypothetical protein
MEGNLTVLYCVVDDFCKEFYPVWESHLLSEELGYVDNCARMSEKELFFEYRNETYTEHVSNETQKNNSF